MSQMKSVSELDDLLREIHSEQLKAMLQDLKNPEKRTPALFQAVRAMLADNGLSMDYLKALQAKEPAAEGSDASQIKQMVHELPPVFDDETDKPTVYQ